MDVIVKVSLLPLVRTSRRRSGDARLAAARRIAPKLELTAEMRPFLRHDREEPIEPGRPYELRIELLRCPSWCVRANGCGSKISNWESTIPLRRNDALVRQKVGTDTYYHNAAQPRASLHERRERTERPVNDRLTQERKK